MKKDQSGIVQVYLLMLLILGAIIGTGYYIRIKTSSKTPTNTHVSQASETSQVPECVSKPMTGQVIFDVAQPAPFVDPRVNEIRKSINASYVTWRNGRIIKIDGVDHSSGQYFATVEEGSEESAVTILKSNPYVTFASNMSTCPLKPKVIVE